MRYIILILLFWGVIQISDLSAQLPAKAKISVSNTGSFPITDKVIEIPWSFVKSKLPNIDTSRLIVLDASGKNQLAFQFEKKGTDSIHNLLLQLSLAKGQTKSVTLSYGNRIVLPTRTYGRFVPERKEDFTWENDKIAFRMYGKELEKTPKENAYGIDVWVKRTEKMVINERYIRGKYHEDIGDGLDYYHVGLTLGAGNCMPYVNDSIYYSKNYTSWKVLDNGPLRTTFELGYDAWDVNGKNVSATKNISIDAGSQMNKLMVTYQYEQKEKLPIAIGIVKRADKGVILQNEQQGIMGYWEPPYKTDGTTGVGVIIPGGLTKMSVTGKQILAYAETKENGTFTYYSGAAWDKAGIITNEQQWFDYLYKKKIELESTKIVFR